MHLIISKCFLHISFRIFGFAIGTSAFLNLLLPGAAKEHVGLVMAVRIMQGIVEVIQV